MVVINITRIDLNINKQDKYKIPVARGNIILVSQTCRS